LGRGIFVHHRVVTVIKRVEFINSVVSYRAQRCRWHNIVVLNVPAPSEEKNDDSKDTFYREIEQVFIIFLSTI